MQSIQDEVMKVAFKHSKEIARKQEVSMLCFAIKNNINISEVEVIESIMPNGDFNWEIRRKI